MPDDPSEFITLGLQRVLGFVASRAGGFVADFFAMVGSLAAMLFALFFMLRDGDTLARKVRERLPLSPPESERLMRETRDLVMASFGAGLTVAAVQGLIGGLAFLMVGFNAPVFWGVVIGFCSLLPIVGAGLVWVPAGLVLLLSGERSSSSGCWAASRRSGSSAW
jgi:predicted PurR-regulated permease PerM